MVNEMFHELERKFPIFLENIGKPEQVKYSSSIITCDADKCEQYRNEWEKAGIPYINGIMIYLISKMRPYNREARVTISAKDFVIKHYKEFEEMIP